MITHAVRPPNVNAQAIESQGLQELGFTQNAPTLNAFGVGIAREMATVPGRVLPAPRVKYRQDADGKDFKADRASWNLRTVKFAKGATLENWAVLLIRDGGYEEFKGPGDPKLREVLEGFADTCGKSGMTVKSKPAIAEVQLPPFDKMDPMRKSAISSIHGTLGESFKQKPKIILVILSSGDKSIYSGLKRLCDVTLDVGELFVDLFMSLPHVLASQQRFVLKRVGFEEVRIWGLWAVQR